jgi:HTH-type transcriptional regulator/antitoxin MqsA
MFENNDPCPICGDGLLKEKTITETFEYKNHFLAVDNYIVYECTECEESFVDPGTLKETEKTIRDFHRKIDGLLTSEEIKEIRVSAGYTQEEFGNMLGGGVKSFARYENGTVTQSRPMDNLLRIIKNFPYALNTLIGKKRKHSAYEPDYILWDNKNRTTHFFCTKPKLADSAVKAWNDVTIIDDDRGIVTQRKDLPDASESMIFSESFETAA